MAKHIKHDKPRLSIVGTVAEQPLSILLVDSDETSFPKARHVLHGLPIASLKTAATAETASALIAAEHFDLVVVDPASLPGGFDLLKEIKDNYRWVATLVASHDHSPQFMRQVVKCRIDGILFRPMTPEEFVEQVLLLAKAVRLSRQRQQKRVLAIGAHPDDVEIGCGGTLARHHAKGDMLSILTLSRGAAGGDVNVRATEAHRAADILGAYLQMANLRDAHISEGVATIEIIEAAIRELKPTHIYTHCSEDNVQFKRAADGVFKLLEVNPRFPGTLPLTAAAGVDIPKLMVDEAMGRPMPDRLMPFKELMVVRYWTEHYFDAREWEALCRRP